MDSDSEDIVEIAICLSRQNGYATDKMNTFGCLLEWLYIPLRSPTFPKYGGWDENHFVKIFPYAQNTLHYVSIKYN